MDALDFFTLARGKFPMRDRAAVRLIACLLVVAVLVASFPAVGLTAAPREGDTAPTWSRSDATVPVDVGYDRGDAPRADPNPTTGKQSESAAAGKDRKSKREARAADADKDRGKARGKDRDKDKGKNHGKNRGNGHGKNRDKNKDKNKNKGKDQEESAPAAAAASAEIWACATRGPDTRKSGKSGKKAGRVLRPVGDPAKCDKNELAVNLNNAQDPIEVCVENADQMIRLLTERGCSPEKRTLLEIPGAAPTNLCLSGRRPQRQKHDRHNGKRNRQRQEHHRFLKVCADSPEPLLIVPSRNGPPTTPPPPPPPATTNAADDAGAGFGTDEDTPFITASVLANDTDPNGDPLTVTALDTTGTKGQVSDNGDGSFAYDPNDQFEALNDGESATDVFSYTVSDGAGNTDTATVTITIAGVNDVTAVDDSGAGFGADEDHSFTTASVLTNDSDPDGDPLSVTGLDTADTKGQVTDNGDGTFLYNPNGQFENLAVDESGSDTFGYTVSDGHGSTGAATVTIAITGVNDPPDAVDDTATTDKGTPTTIDVLANDNDPDATDTLSVSIDSSGTLGQVTDNGDGTVLYDPNGQFGALGAGDSATDTFAYTVSDGHSGADTASVVVTITGVNDDPTAVDDAFGTNEDTHVTTTSVLANDTDPNSDPLSVVDFDTTGTIGEVTDNGGGTFLYNPNGQFEALADGESATDTFTYTVSDGNGGTDSATVTIQVTGLQDPPVANDDAATVAEDSGATGIDVLANDSDADGDSLDITAVGDPAGGATAITGAVPNEQVDYTPDADECNDLGAIPDDTFIYTVNDGIDTATATVSVLVTCVNDAPTAADDTLSPVAEDSPQVAISFASLLSNDSTGPLNESSQTLDINNVANPVGGTVQISGTDVLFTADATYNGPASFDYTITDDGQTGGAADPKTDVGSASFTITEVNDAPTAVDDTLAAIAEDSGPHLIAKASLTGNDSAGPANESTQNLDVTDVTNVVGGSAIIAGANVEFTPAPNFNGLASFDYTLADDGTTNGAPDPKTDIGSVSFAIDAVNNPPAITAPATVVSQLNTDTVISGVSIADPDADPDAIAVTLSVAAGTLTLADDVSGGLAAADITGNGTGSLAVSATQAKINATLADSAGLTYHAPSAGTSDTLNLGADDLGHNGSGGAKTDAESVTIQFNQAPTANAQTISTDEDTETAVTLTATDPENDPLTFIVTALPASGGALHEGATAAGVLITAVPHTLPGTEVTYVPPANQSGAGLESFSFKANDGSSDSNVAAVTIDVTAVNDAPVLASEEGTPLEYTENDAPTQLTNAITVADVENASLNQATVQITGNYQNGQDVLAFVNTASITGSFDASSGILTLSGVDTLANYQAALRAVTYANTSDTPSTLPRTVTFQVRDDGSPNQLSNTVMREIAITAVNDAPTISDIGNQTTDEDVATGVIAFTVGDVDDAADSLLATGSSSNTTLVPAANIVLGGSGANRTVTITPAANQFETTTITLTVTDSGNATDSDTFDLTVNPVNDVPTAQAQTLATSSGIRITIGAGDTGTLKSGAADPDDAAGDLTVSATFANVDAGATVALTDPATGTYSYNPAAGFTGTDVFQYTVCDDGAPLAPQQCSAPANVTVTIGGTDLWFVDDSAAPGGTGRLTDPFQSLTSLPAGRGAGDRIFLFSGSYATGHTLPVSEQLIGQGASGSTFDALLGVSIPANGTLDTRPTVGGIAPTLGNTVNLASNAKVQGVAIVSAANTGMANPAAVTGVTVSQTSITTTTGTALSLNNAGGSLDFTNISKNGTGTGISLTTVNANTNVAAGAIQNTTATGVAISGGNGSFSYGGSINSDTGTLVSVASATGGTKTFSGSITDGNDGDGSGISLTGNGGATINFTGGSLVLSTGSNPAFTATGGGTVSVTGANNTLTTTTGTALNVANTAIGASGLTFRSISVNGAASGIVLNTTGTTAGTNGGLSVTGTGTTDGSGGTIQSTSGRGASFITARDVSLKNMNFTNAGTTDLDADNSGLSTGDNLDTNAAIHLQTVTTATLDNLNISGGAEQGINGNQVAGFTLSNSSITDVGNGPDEDAIHFFNMTGTSAITNTTINSTIVVPNTTGGDDHLNLQMQAGTLTLNITGGSATNANKGSGYLFGIRGTANATINFTNANSSNNFSGGIVADAFGDATMKVTVTNSTSSGNNDQLSVSAGDNSNVDLNATGNTLSSPNAADFVVVGLLGSAFDTGYTLDANISGNTITVGNGRTADGIFIFNAGGGVIRGTITGNTIDYAGTQRVIAAQAGQDGSGSMDLTITGNDIDIELDGAGNGQGILAQTAVTGPGNTSSMCADIGGAGALSNTFTHSLGGTVAAGDIRVRQRFDGTVRLPGYAGSPTDPVAVVAYLNGRNAEVSTSTATLELTVGITGGGACAQPAF